MNICNFSGSTFNKTSVIDNVSNLYVNYTNKSDSSLRYDMLYLFVKWKFYPYMKCVMCSMGTLTNVLVLVTIIKCWKFWQYSSGLLMLTLACVDVIGNIIQVMAVLSLYHVSSGYGILTPLVVYLYMTLSGISNFMMMLISLNRYALVCKPFSHFGITSKKSTTIQIIAIAITLPCLNIYHLINFFSGNYPIDIFTTGIVIVYVLISHTVPIGVSVVLTIFVIHELRNNTSDFGDSRNLGPPRNGEKNITKAMIAVIVAFILLTVPHTVGYTVDIVRIWIRYKVNGVTFHPVLILLRDINYSINIFIYAAYIPTFREALKDILKCMFVGRTGQHRNYHKGNTNVSIVETQESTL